MCLCRGSEILNPFVCHCWGSEILNLWGIRNTEYFPVLFGDQKFWILRCALWGSEIRNPSLYSLGIRNSEFFPVLLGGSVILSLATRSSKNRLVFYAWLKHYTAVQIKNRTLLGRIFWFLANRETFHVSFNASLRFRGYCKNHVWNKVAIMDFRLSSTLISEGTPKSAK